MTATQTPAEADVEVKAKPPSRSDVTAPASAGPLRERAVEHLHGSRVVSFFAACPVCGSPAPGAVRRRFDPYRVKAAIA